MHRAQTQSWIPFQRLVRPQTDVAIGSRFACFAHTEHGSGLDMLDATCVEHEPRLRRAYYRHALDELEHARIFREAATQRLPAHHPARHALHNAAELTARGLRSYSDADAPYDRGPFLRFVWYHEKRAVEQFEQMARRNAGTEVEHILRTVLKDEAAHVGYAKTQVLLDLRDELRRAIQEDPRLAPFQDTPRPPRAALAEEQALRDVARTHWFNEMKARLHSSAVAFGHVMTAFWLGLFYLTIAMPFAVVARMTTSDSGFREPCASHGPRAQT